MTTDEIRERYLSFFEERGHLRIPSASLVPSAHDPSALLTVAGMHPLKPYFLAQEAPPAPNPQPAPVATPQLIHEKDYSKPQAAFPNILRPYQAQDLPQPNLGNSPRIDSLLRDGKIYLSIDDAVALALENNLDLDIARYNLNIADADLLRAKSGAGGAPTFSAGPGPSAAGRASCSISCSITLRTRSRARASTSWFIRCLVCSTALSKVWLG